MSREQIIRDTAYAIWEAEGRPDGRAAEHWRMAEVQVVASTAPPPRATRKAPARSAASKTAGDGKVGAPKRKPRTA